jgi:hypothetical protein
VWRTAELSTFRVFGKAQLGGKKSASSGAILKGGAAREEMA